MQRSIFAAELLNTQREKLLAAGGWHLIDGCASGTRSLDRPYHGRFRGSVQRPRFCHVGFEMVHEHSDRLQIRDIANILDAG
jgi:hypothetical protein